ncbi:MAG: hypothetical protein RLZZ543_916 [Bacteroidota bacterium]|jgi:4'-phosphopantetheinyl transferase EntD
MKKSPYSNGFQQFENSSGSGLIAWVKLPLAKRTVSAAEQKAFEKQAVLELIQAHLGEQFLLKSDDFGKPWPIDGMGNISISHSASHIAFAFHPSTTQGIDIETHRPQLQKVAERVLHTSERDKLEAAADKQFLLQVFWGAKEAMYKAYGKKQLIFSTQLIVDTLPNETGNFYGRIVLPAQLWKVELQLIQPDSETFLVFVKDVQISEPA